MRSSFRAASLAVVLTFAGHVQAADAVPPGQRDAQSRFEEGLARVRAGDYEAARVSFEQAYAVIKRPSVLWNLALAEEKTGHLVDALGHFKRLVADPAAPASDREDARRHATALRAQTGHLDIQAPAGAILRVDSDASAGIAPLAEEVDVLPGHHVVQARINDDSQSFPVDVAAGQALKVIFGLPGSPGPATSPAPGAATPGDATGQVAVSAPPASYEGTGARRASAAPRGDGGGTTANSNASAPTSSGRPQTVTAFALGGAAVVAAGLGVYFAVKSHADATDAASLRANGTLNCQSTSSSDCTRLSDTVRRQNRDATASDILYVAAGAFAIGTIGAILFWPRPPHAAKAWVAPAVGAGMAGVTGGGAF